MLIFKVFRSDEWAHFEARSKTCGSRLDLMDGFIHFSTAEQTGETVRRHFSGENDLVLAAVDVAPLGEDLKWETSRGGDLFPHLYRELHLAEICWHRRLELVDGHHDIPDLSFAV